MLQNIFIRARGWYSTGNETGSGSLAESVRNAYFAPLLQFTLITRLGNGHVLLNGIGARSSADTIQVSSNLNPASFHFAASVNADANGVFQYDDPTTTNQVRRFYRLTYP